MKSMIALVGILGLALFATACGKDKNKDATKEEIAGMTEGTDTAQAYEEGTKNCSKKIIEEGDFFRNTTLRTVEDLKALRGRVVSFKRKYAGVVCNTQNEQNVVESHDVTKVCDQLIQQIDAAIKQMENTNGGNNGTGGSDE